MANVLWTSWNSFAASGLRSLSTHLRPGRRRRTQSSTASAKPLTPPNERSSTSASSTQKAENQLPTNQKINHGIDQPGPLPPATAHLDDSCADGARSQRPTVVAAPRYGGAVQVGVREGSTSTLIGEQFTRVRRWMSRVEYDAMRQTGHVQEGAGGTTYVAHPVDPNAFGREVSLGVFTLNSMFPKALHIRLASRVGLRYQGRTRCMADSRRSADKIF
jgi:hypothetical protein